MIYLIAYVVVLAVLEIFRDGYAIINHTYSSNQKLSHRYAWCARALAVTVPVVQKYGVTWDALIRAVMLGLLFWLIFNPGLNLKRGKRGMQVFYVGVNNWLDKSIRSAALKLSIKPETVNMYLKVGIFIVLITWAVLG